MDKQAQPEKIKVYIVIVLLIVAAIMAYFRFFSKSRTSVSQTVSASAADLYDIPRIPAQMSEVFSPAADEKAPYAPPRRDIFAPMAAAPPELVDTLDTTNRVADRRPNLSGIMHGAHGTQAIIDGKIVRVGETVGGYTVSEIGQRQVILTSPTERLVLTVGN